ncbi:HAD family hydrolase [Wenyingzhuangia sp. IMCC45574]
MNLAEVKLIVSDMDGTLLNSDHEVSELFFRQFKALKERGIQFVAASGRQYYSIVDKLGSIKEDIIVVAENGAYVVANNKELFVNAFKSEDAKNFIKVAQEIPGIYLVLAGKKKAYYLKGNPALEAVVSEYYSEYELLDNFDELPDDDILKLAIHHSEGSEANIYPYVEKYAGEWQVKVSGEFWVDIALPTNHKGNAVERIQEEMGITAAETMAFGDYMNDVEMLKKSKYSFAMENAHPKVKEIANYGTSSNDENGVEAVIEKLIGEF